MKKLSKHESLVYEHISRNLLNALSKRGFKQEVLAEMLGMRQPHLSEKLHVKRGVQVIFLVRLSAATGIPLSELIDVGGIENTVCAFKTEIIEGINQSRLAPLKPKRSVIKFIHGGLNSSDSVGLGS